MVRRRTGGWATRGGDVSFGSAGPGAPELPGTAGRSAVGAGVAGVGSAVSLPLN